MDKLTVALNLVKPAVKFIPVVGEPLQAGIETLIKILETVEQTKSNKETLASIGERTARLSLNIAEKCKGGTEAQFHQRLEDKLKPLLVAFEEARKFFVDPDNSQHKTAQNVKRFLSAPKDKDALKSLSEALDRAIADFLFLSNMDQLLQLDRMDGAVSRVLVGVDRVITGADDDRLRMRLKPVTTAIFSAGAAALCHEGTFVDLLEELVHWATSNDAQPVFWLSGQAGTGKSTVARTLCNRLANSAVAETRIIASFFISRLADADRRDPLRIIHTLSYFLARQLPTFRTSLLEVLNSSAEVTDCGVGKQFGELFAKPLASCDDGMSPEIVVVLDAVDECDAGDDYLGREGGDLLPLLLSTVQATKLRIRLLVTSRSTPSISRMFHDYRPQAVSQSSTADCIQFLYQRSIEVSLLRPDIKRYFDKEFGIIAEYHHFTDWPAPAAVDSLVEKANGLFIYANTVVRFVSGALDPKKNLQVLVSTSTSTSSPIEYANLDNTYTRVLETAAASTAGPSTSRYNAALIRRLLRTLAVIQEPRSAMGLSRLLGVEEDGEKEVDAVLSRLAAVLTRSDAGEISFYHASFPDYLLDETRCSDERFRGSCINAHRALGIRCLEIMNQSLRRDMARLGDGTKYDLDVDDRISETFSSKLKYGLDVDDLISGMFSSELKYAISYWHHHLLETAHGGSLSDCSDQLKTFCEDHLLHWVEACCLLGISDDLQGIFLSCCQATSENGSLTADLLRDAARFFPHFRGRLRPQMVYYWAALFLPDCHLLRSVFRSLGETSLPAEIVGRAASWDDLPVDLNLPYTLGTDAPDRIRLIGSPDGSRLLLVSEWLPQKHLQLYDTFSGAPLQTMVVHDRDMLVASVAFDPPGDCIALLTREVESTHEIHVWNLASDTKASHSYRCPPDYNHVLAMAFQPGDHSVSVVLSNLIEYLVVTFAVDYNGDNIRFGETTLHPLVFPSGDTPGVRRRFQHGSYSYRGEYCAIASALIVNVYQGTSCVATLETPPSAVSALQFSPPLPRDGPNLAAGGADGSVVVWSVKTTAIIHSFAGLSDVVQSLAFSTTMLAAVTEHTAVVWSLDDFRCIWKAQMHTDGIVLPPPAPPRNARLFITASTGYQSYLVRGLSLAAALTTPIYESVELMQFSPDNSLLYSISRSAVSIWDVQTGRYLQSFLFRGAQNRNNTWSMGSREASWDTCARHGLLLCMSPSQTPSWARDSTGQWVPHPVQSDCNEPTTTPESYGLTSPYPSHYVHRGRLNRIAYKDAAIWLRNPGHPFLRPICAPRFLFPVPDSKRPPRRPTRSLLDDEYMLIWTENGEYLAIGHDSGDVTIFKLSAEIAHLLTLPGPDTAESDTETGYSTESESA